MTKLEWIFDKMMLTVGVLLGTIAFVVTTGTFVFMVGVLLKFFGLPSFIGSGL